MSMPGSDLSQPAKVTRASKRSACITVSTESAMTSRLTSEARMPSWPIEMPSDTAMVTNSIGKPPACAHPLLGPLGQAVERHVARVTSFHDEATPTWGLSQSSSVMPTARSMARAGARSGPSVTSWLRGLHVRDHSRCVSADCVQSPGSMTGPPAWPWAGVWSAAGSARRLRRWSRRSSAATALPSALPVGGRP